MISPSGPRSHCSPLRLTPTAAVKSEAPEETASHVLSEVGPSVSAAAVSECLAFAVGSLTRIPALQQFCVVAGLAVLIDYVMQLTWFLAALSVDARRAKVPWRRVCVLASLCASLCVCAASSQPECVCFCCLLISVSEFVTWLCVRVCDRVQAKRMDVFCCIRDTAALTPPNKFWTFVSNGEYVRTFLKKYYAPFLMLTPVRVPSPVPL